MSTAEARYVVHDLKATQPTRTFSAINPRYWVIDRTTNLPVDEFASKRTATLTARDMNREEGELQR